MWLRKRIFFIAAIFFFLPHSSSAMTLPSFYVILLRSVPSYSFFVCTFFFSCTVVTCYIKLSLCDRFCGGVSFYMCSFLLFFAVECSGPSCNTTCPGGKLFDGGGDCSEEESELDSLFPPQWCSLKCWCVYLSCVRGGAYSINRPFARIVAQLSISHLLTAFLIFRWQSSNTSDVWIVFLAIDSWW